MRRALRAVDVGMALLFAFSAAVQFNDPDPGRWVAIYAVACAITVAAALGRGVSRLLLGAVAIVTIIWAAAIALGGPGAGEYAHMFDAWEMASLPVEEAREASGLLIVAVWMTVLFVRDWRRYRRRWRPELS
jgi:hypothetical protein